MAPDPDSPLDRTLARLNTHHAALSAVAAWAQAHPDWELFHTGGTWFAHPKPSEVEAITADLLDGAEPGTVTRDESGVVSRSFGTTSIRAICKATPTVAWPVVLNPAPEAEAVHA